jgi:prevent-host-death family protein
MPQIGVRELKNQATEIVRNVREKQEKYIITYHGQPVAVLLPVNEALLQDKAEEALETMLADQNLWAGLDSFRREINLRWRAEKTAVDLVAEQRR